MSDLITKEGEIVVFPRNMGRSWILAECRKFFEEESKREKIEDDSADMRGERDACTCNDCALSMQNCHDMSICCEDETGLCDWFVKLPRGEE